MDSHQAKEILLRFRPDSKDANDPEFAQALEQSRRDPELGRWFEQHCAFQIAIRDRLKQVRVPAGLKENIVARHQVLEVPGWWRRPAFQALAAAAAITLLMGLAWFRWQPREQTSFAACRDRVVRNALRGYMMDITTTNLADIRNYLAVHDATADYVLPAALQKLPGDGGGVVRWRNKKVSMVCFALNKRDDLYLFVADWTDFPDAPASAEPEFTRIGQLLAASWSKGERTYILAAKGDERFLRSYLGP